MPASGPKHVSQHLSPAQRVKDLEEEVRKIKNRLGESAGASAWCDVNSNYGAFDGGVELDFNDVVLACPIRSQSGPFEQIDAYTIGVPPGIWTVDLSFSILWNLKSDYASWLTLPDDATTSHWLAWNGGALYRGPGSVETYSQDNPGGNVTQVAPYHIMEGGGAAQLSTGHSPGATYWNKQFAVHADAENNRLSFGVKAIEIYMKRVPDFSDPKTISVEPTQTEFSADCLAMIQGTGP